MILKISKNGEMIMKVKLIMVLLLFSSALIYAQEHLEQKNTYIFIDISGSMTPVFPQVRKYVKDTIIPTVPLNSKLHIFKFYKKLVPIFNQTIRSNADKEYAARRVGLLLSNGPWTNIDNIFAYLNENQLNNKNAVVYICTDGYEQLENYTKEYRITADTVTKYASDMKLEDKSGWFVLTWKIPAIVAVIPPIEQKTVEESITVAHPSIQPERQQKVNVHIALPILIIFLIISMILIITALVNYFAYAEAMKKSVSLTQLEIIKKNAKKYFCIISFLFIAELVCFIWCVFSNAVFFPALVLQIAYIVFSLVVDVHALKIIFITYPKRKEIAYIYNHLLAEAEKYDIYIEKDITPEDVAEITDTHQQLVMGIICLKGIEFDQKTKLNNLDKTFMLFAVALQCCRQYLLTYFKDRKSDQQLAKETKKDIGKPEFDNNGDYKTPFDFVKDAAGHKEHSDREHEDYNPSLEEIITNPVPFDTIQRADNTDTDIAQHGGHRYTTLGHDSILGWLFGTANIATSTLTDYKFQSWHVRTGVAYQRNGKDIEMDMMQERANTGKILYYTQQKLFHEEMDGKKKIAAALIKEAIHLKSDVRTPKGLPIPIIPSALSPEFASKLAKYGLDTENIKTVGQQAAAAKLINVLIGMIHRLTLDSESNDEKLFMVRTKKIINYSTYIAEGSNVLAVALRSCCGDKNAWKQLDIGGIVNGIKTVLSNRAIIRRIKIDFILNNLDKQSGYS